MSACKEEGLGSIPGSGKSPGGGHSNSLQCSRLENSRDGGAWWAAVYGAAQSRQQQQSLQMVIAAMKLKDTYSLEGKL